MNYNEVKGDLIHLAKNGTFDVITHGCNCLSTMGAGIAVPMKNEFGCDKFPMELQGPDINKLGCIDYKTLYFEDEKWVAYPDEGGKWVTHEITVVNSYTQYKYGRNHSDGDKNPLDYEAITLCMRKLNSVFKGKHIGLPYVIGAGLAGGDKDKIKGIIKKELKDCNVTLVKLPHLPW